MIYAPRAYVVRKTKKAIISCVVIGESVTTTTAAVTNNASLRTFYTDFSARLKPPV